ncbi:P-loop containing nucleoside triphosphate hydrolase protein [Nemania abortiva]|nr:P-loop containing nucleoside triphosphate hydrolase protein [Nemania abortiva]
MTSPGENDSSVATLTRVTTDSSCSSPQLGRRDNSVSGKEYSQEALMSRMSDLVSSVMEDDKQKDLAKDSAVCAPNKTASTEAQTQSLDPSTPSCGPGDDEKKPCHEQAERSTTLRSPSPSSEPMSEQGQANGREETERHGENPWESKQSTNGGVSEAGRSTEGGKGHLKVENVEKEEDDGLEDGDSSDEEDYKPEDIEDDSEARLEWIRQKREEGAENPHLDKLMCQVGLEELKSTFLSMKSTVEAVRRRGGKIDLHLSVAENPGLAISVEELYEGFRESLNIDNTSLTSTYNLQIPDYSDDELCEILKRMLKRHSIEVEGGIDGPYARILARRVGRGRESESFENMDSMKNAFAEACSRQADRLKQERIQWVENGKTGDEPNIFFFTKEDLLGLPPPDMRQQSAAYQEIQGMVGLETLKEAVEELMDVARTNYFLELRGKQLIRLNLNRVFLGPPGAGKTTLSKLFGQILVDTKLVSKAEVVVKHAGDFMAPCIGGSARITKLVLNQTQGKVLIIDDAHRLCPSSDRQRTESNSDKMLFEILDTLVSGTSADPGQDRCIILVGYAEQMRDLFYKSNPGLRSRFPLESTTELGDYDLSQLMEILDLKLKTDGIGATEGAKEVASQILARARHRPGFGNVYEVHNLVSRAWASKRRVMKQRKRFDSDETPEDDESDEQDELTPEDFDPNWDRLSAAGLNCQEQFKDYVGFEMIVEKFQELQETVVGMRLYGRDPRPHIPFTFVFKGPPGTGKTSTARKLGSLFYDMGFLASEEVLECSATDLIGKYLGHTGPLVQSMLEKALGKVLFIDEAYRLGAKSRGASGSSFEEEAIGEIVDSLTKPRFAQKIVIVLAGYSEDMDNLMMSNRGLRGRFATEIIFPALNPEQSILLLERLIGGMGIAIRDETVPIMEKNSKVYGLLEKLSATRNWANARDIETLANTVVGEVFRQEARKGKKSSRLQVSTDQLILLLEGMLESRVGKPATWS